MASSTQQRLLNTTASLPIVYGSIAFFLGKKADELKTHEWTLFLRGPNPHNDHLSSNVISKVVFELHQSFAKPSREISEPPYEVTERGWGEFEAQIRIHWKDPTEQPTILNHTIKLYPQGMHAATNSSSSSNALIQQSGTETPVLAETYDEVVFTNPTQSFFHSLTQITAVPTTNDKHKEEASASDFNDNDAGNDNDKNKRVRERVGEKSSTSASASSTNTSIPIDQQQQRQPSAAASSPSSSWRKHLNVIYSDRETFLALIAAQKFLQEELSKVKQRFQVVNDEITVVDQKLLMVQQQKQREAAAAAAAFSSGTSSNNHAAVGGLANANTTTTSSSSSEQRKRTKKSRSSSSQTTTKKPRAGTCNANNKQGSGINTNIATATTAVNNKRKTPIAPPTVVVSATANVAAVAAVSNTTKPPKNTKVPTIALTTTTPTAALTAVAGAVTNTNDHQKKNAVNKLGPNFKSISATNSIQTIPKTKT